jgi:hypothetical protein
VRFKKRPQFDRALPAGRCLAINGGGRLDSSKCFSVPYRRDFPSRPLGGCSPLEPSQRPADDQKLMSTESGGDEEAAPEDPFGEINIRPLFEQVEETMEPEYTTYNFRDRFSARPKISFGQSRGAFGPLWSFRGTAFKNSSRSLIN